MHYTVVIPARLASSRLPNKPLADIAGVPMVVRVAQRVRGGVSADVRILVATDSVSVIEVCKTWGVESVLTRADHACGTDRLAEVCDILALPDDAIVVNVQGDEPLIEPDLVNAVAQALANRPNASMATAAYPVDSVEDLTNPNVVKVVLNSQSEALYFSRAPIPWWRDGYTHTIAQLSTPLPLRHIGIYSYRAHFLRQFPKLPSSPLEAIESLEQLRALWHGHRIAVHTTPIAPGPGVDTAQDLERVRKIFDTAPN